MTLSHRRKHQNRAVEVNVNISAHINTCVSISNMTDLAGNLFFLHPMTLLTVYIDKI